MGQPDGGWYDDTPPRIVHTSPRDKAVGVKERKITIAFDEFIKLEDATSNVVVSPPQLEMPEIKAAGKKIVVELKDTLKENTTYTIDFSDAITDNNEGNPMGNYTYSFSTGEQIDTLEVSGHVLEAENLEPVKGILVGLYDDLTDTAFATKPMTRVARTDGSGRFVIKGVAPGNYRIYALKDMDADYVFSQKGEMVAFSHDTFSPSCKPDIRQDTIWRDELRIDSIARVPYMHFYPDDIVLRAFTAPQTDRYLLKTERNDERKIGMYFSYGNDSLPEVRGLDFDAEGAFVVETTEKKDTVFYWLKDTSLVNKDTLQMEIKYLMTDSTGALVNKLDTVDMFPKLPYEKRQKLLQDEIEKWEKARDKAKKKGEPYDSIMPVKNMVPKIGIPSMMAPDRNVMIEVPVPLARLDTAAIHLYSKHDTLWYRSQTELSDVPGKLRFYELRAEWRPGVEYSLEIDSAAFEDIYGTVSGPIKQGLRVGSMDEYCSLVVNLSGISDTLDVIVQILTTSGNVVKQSKASAGVVEFYYLQPGKYYLSAFVDRNGNGVWDTGDYTKGLQPEEVYYNPKEVECKPKWDLTTSWNLTAVPLTRQKPSSIVKQKPDKEKKLRNRNADRAREKGIEYKPQ
ncbi:MAG: Ig-like domain-containing protein [Prevotella sp.]|nr:Ig-like domain-containing protein [Prevotella sp.]